MKRWVAASLALLLAACDGASVARTGARSVHVYAASSLREATEELAREFEQEHPGLELVLNFAASNVLAQQAVAARQADVFLSADTLQLDAVAQAGLVAARAPRPWLSNQLVVIVPSSARELELSGASELADERFRRISLGNPAAVPVGRYARAWLEQAGAWSAVEARIVPGTDVRATLAAVESGACEAGVVYATDARTSERVRIVFRVPPEAGPRIEYALGLLRGQAAPADAREVFANFQSRAARDAFLARGFLAGGSEAR